MSYAAVLFDLDGTLVDSTPLFRDALLETFHPLGVSMDVNFFWKWHAHRMPFQALFDHHAVTEVDEASFKRAMGDRFLSLVHEHAQWNEGAIEVATFLASRAMPLGIVTNAVAPYVEALTAKLRLRDYFPVVITAADTLSKPKPDPCGLVLAARRLEVDPCACVYVGDQLFDMKAALNAGMDRIFYRAGDGIDASDHATAVVTRLIDLIPLLVDRNLINR